MPSIKRIAVRVTAALIAAVTLGSTIAFADEPYDGYNYDWWEDPVPSQSGYVVDRVISGTDMGIGAMTEPADMFISDDEKIYIADTAYKGTLDSTMKGRIIIADKDFNIEQCIEYLDFSNVQDWLAEMQERLIETPAQFVKCSDKYFDGPTGVFVDDDGFVYVADNANDRVVKFTVDVDADGIGYGKVDRVFTRPDSDVYDANTTFNPSKVLVDAAGNVYICIKSITKGAVVFSKDGEFNGYFGANRVEATADVIMNAFWKLIFSREQVKRMQRSVPVEISNFDIDDENFIYTVTESKSVATDIIKKLNSAGTNIFINLGYSDNTFGDALTKYYRGQTYSSQITDVDIGENGVINLLDLKTGRVFQYDNECNLLFIFGGKGSQKGTFQTVNAVESIGTKVYVLDGRKASITVFKQTEFGDLVHEAITLFNKGKYEEALEPWQEVLRRDSNYWLAYIGIGNAYLNRGEPGDYEIAMEYFIYNSKVGYNDAFKGWRMNFIRDNFTIIAIILVALLVAVYVIASLRGKMRAKKIAEAEKLFKAQNKGKEE